MPPQVDTTYAGSYLQMLATLLVFALGVPALFLQLAVSEEIRRAMFRRRAIAVWYAAAAAVGVGCLGFVWFLHPCASEMLGDRSAYLSGAVMTAAVIICVLVGIFVVARQSRDRFVRGLEGELARRPFRPRDFDRDLAVLVALGESGSPGYEKRVILDALARVWARLVQTASGATGIDLGSIVMAVEGVALKGSAPATEGNLEQAIAAIRQIKADLEDLGRGDSNTYRLANRALSRLGIAAVAKDHGPATLNALEAARPDTAALLAVGVAAFTSGRYMEAQAALDKLGAVGEVSPIPESSPAVFDLLGLIAHFWTAGGAARRRALVALGGLTPNAGPALQFIVQRAIAYHEPVGRYDTADQLSEFYRGLIEPGQEKYPPGPASGGSSAERLR